MGNFLHASLMNAITSDKGNEDRSSRRSFLLPQLISGSSMSDSYKQLLKIPSSDNVTDDSPIVNQRLRIYDNQVGGHTEFVKPGDSRLLLKPYDHYEFNFYNELRSERFRYLLPFTARCYGEVDVEGASSSDSSQAGTPASAKQFSKYVMLEDLAHGLEKPCILDIKMGVMQRSLRNTSEEKLARARAKSLATTSHLLGLRICGVVYHDPVTDERIYRNKYEGRSLDVLGTYRAFLSFFESVASPDSRKTLILIFVEKLSRLRDVVAKLTGVRFWSGSLLLVYDAASPQTATLKMIDFAQSAILLEDPGTPDFEYLYGIDSLLSLLIAASSNEPQPPIRAEVAPLPDAQTEELFSLTRA